MTKLLVVLFSLLTLKCMFSVTSNNLIKRYGKKEVFRDINFSIDGAYSIGIQGPNGSGKTTLLKCLSGLIRPTKGNLLWYCNETHIDLRMIRYFIGYSGPYIHLYQELSVSENLAFMSHLRTENNPDIQNITSKQNEQIKHANIIDRTSIRSFFQFLKTNLPPLSHHFSPLWGSIDDISHFFNLGLLLETPYGLLSSGQQQRVRLAAAMIPGAPILMLDEPGTNLDSNGTKMIHDLIDLQKKAGGMVFLASNRSDELNRCDHFISLSS